MHTEELDWLAKQPNCGSIMKCLAVIRKHTVYRNRFTAKIAMSIFEQDTNLSTKTVRSALLAAEKGELISVDRRRSIYAYSLRKSAKTDIVMFCNVGGMNSLHYKTSFCYIKKHAKPDFQNCDGCNRLAFRLKTQTLEKPHREQPISGRQVQREATRLLKPCRGTKCPIQLEGDAYCDFHSKIQSEFEQKQISENIEKHTDLIRYTNQVRKLNPAEVYCEDLALQALPEWAHRFYQKYQPTIGKNYYYQLMDGLYAKINP